ncbi:MAG: hypothetical protein ABI702_07890 [Burkholderiales bacterium]
MEIAFVKWVATPRGNGSNRRGEPGRERVRSRHGARRTIEGLCGDALSEVAECKGESRIEADFAGLGTVPDAHPFDRAKRRGATKKHLALPPGACCCYQIW